MIAVSRHAVVSVITTLLVLGVTGTAARGQSPDTQPDSTHAVLFDSDVPLQLWIEVDLRTLINDRDSLEAEEHEATLSYRVGDAEPVALDVKLKTRGHWRRQRRNCDFPPLRLNFPRSRVGGTVFANQDKLKLVTPCRPGRDVYEEYVLREYVAYKIYNLLTPHSLRVRLARTTYVDTSEREDSLTVYTFLLEHAEQMAVRNDGMLLETLGARFEDVDPLELGLVAVFLYMIGGTDWSLGGLHNIELVQDMQRAVYYPVTYDFDWTGIVNTSYAVPDSRLPIRTVRQRLYRGRCLSEEQWNAVLAPFRERREAIYALYENLPGLSARYVRDTQRYLDEFYDVIDDPRKLRRELIGRCRAEGGVR